MENKNEIISIINKKLHLEIVISIIKEIIEDTLNFIIESGFEQNDYDEIIIIDDPTNEEELNKIGAKQKGVELIEKKPIEIERQFNQAFFKFIFL